MQNSNAGGGGEPDEFMEVWDRNLEDAFIKIRQIAESYKYVGMVTKFVCYYTVLYFNPPSYHTPNMCKGYRIPWSCGKTYRRVS